MESPLLEFIKLATTTKNLRKIQQEVLGEPLIAESDDDEEEEEVEGEEQKQPKLKPGDRLPSKTLQKLVDAKYGQDCGDRESDFTCMVSFIGDFIADLDFGTKAKNGRRNWTGEQKEELAEW